MSIDRTIVEGEHLQDTADVMRSSRTMLATCRAALASYAAVEERRAASKVASRWPNAGGGRPPSLGSSAVRRSRLPHVSWKLLPTSSLLCEHTGSDTMAITASFLTAYYNSLAVHTRSCQLRQIRDGAFQYE